MNSTHAHFNISARETGAKLKPHGSVCNLEGLQDSGDPVRLGQKEPFRAQMYTKYKVNAVTTANSTKQRLLGKDRVQL